MEIDSLCVSRETKQDDLRCPERDAGPGLVSCPLAEKQALPPASSMAGVQALGAGSGRGPSHTLGEGGSQVSSCSAEASSSKNFAW